MSKIVLADAASGLNLSVINENAGKIEEHLNEKVLYRDNPSGEPNQMENILDMNNKRIINLPAPESPNDAARLSDIPFDPIPIGTTTALLTTFTPAGTISSINVQTAIEEVASESVQESDLADTTLNSKGVGMSGFNPTLSYAAGTLGWHETSTREWNCSDYPWLAKFDNATDDTAAILACLAALEAAGGGTMVMPAGTARVTSVDYVISSSVNISIRGSGQQATKLKKIGATTTPVLKLSSASLRETYSELVDFTVVGLAKAHHGIVVEKLARFTTRHVGINTCDVGWESLGCLVVNHHAPSWTDNNIGFRCRKSGTIYSNLVQFFGGEIRNNTTFGIDIGEASGLHFYGTDIENNGTAANIATGAVKIRATVDDESGFAVIGFHGCWFESNLGSNFVCDAAGGLNLTLAECKLLSSEGGRALNVAAISSITLVNVVAGSGADVVTLAAARSYVNGGVISTLTDTSTRRVHENVDTAAGNTAIRHAAASGTLTINGGSLNSGSGSVVTVTAVAATMFAAPDFPGLYIVYAYIDDVGAAYMANARIAYDGTNLVRLSGDNGANLTITVSGLNVQTTQTSGAGQTVQYAYLRIA